jgi:hypothetical protein
VGGAVVGGVLVAGVAAVAAGEVKVAVRAESDAAAVVVEVRLVDFEEDFFGVKVGRAAVRLEFGKGPSVVPVRRDMGLFGGAVNDEKASVGRVLGMEGQTEQAAFVKALVEFGQFGSEIEPRRGRAVFVHLVDDANLVCDQEIIGIGNALEGGGRDEAFGHWLQGDGRGGVGRG